ncbi:MAG: hypothetical protein DBY02_04705 [Coprobacter fastidiosus]|nr:MAG: hypothetical protein DBY02_04705 [Coprobacter fastidiosus]
MKREESTLACMKHFHRTATYDTTFFELLLKDVRDSLDCYDSIETQFVVVSVYGYLTSHDRNFTSYLEFLAFLESVFQSFDPELHSSFNIRFYDHGACRYYPLFSIYEKVRDTLYRRFENAIF